MLDFFFGDSFVLSEQKIHATKVHVVTYHMDPKTAVLLLTIILSFTNSKSRVRLGSHERSKYSSSGKKRCLQNMLDFPTSVLIPSNPNGTVNPGERGEATT